MELSSRVRGAPLLDYRPMYLSGHVTLQLLSVLLQLQVDPKNFFENRLRESGLRMKNTLLIRGKPLNRLQWDMRPTEINAYYSPNHNKIGGLIIMNCYKLTRNDAS